MFILFMPCFQCTSQLWVICVSVISTGTLVVQLFGIVRIVLLSEASISAAFCIEESISCISWERTNLNIIMEIMEEGNLMDRVRILLQRDMGYYQAHQTVLQENLCPGVVGGLLDFPHYASFAAVKLVCTIAYAVRSVIASSLVLTRDKRCKAVCMNLRTINLVLLSQCSYCWACFGYFCNAVIISDSVVLMVVRVVNDE